MNSLSRNKVLKKKRKSKYKSTQPLFPAIHSPKNDKNCIETNILKAKIYGVEVDNIPQLSASTKSFKKFLIKRGDNSGTFDKGTTSCCST